MKFVCLKYPKIEMTYKAEIVREVAGTIIKEARQIIKFEKGYYETDDKEKIAFIKRHVDFGNGNICVVEGQEDLKTDVKEPEIKGGDITPEKPETDKSKPKRRGRAKKVE